MTPREREVSRGSTLLEVVLAIALLATSGIGLVATQLSLSRHGQSAAMRAQAAFIVDAFAEMAIDASEHAGAAEQWKARTPVLIPGGVVSTSAAAADTSKSTVSWLAKSYGPASGSDDVHMGCPAEPGRDHRECVTTVFAR
jgi:Tfp pilus assembly protein PilV